VEKQPEQLRLLGQVGETFHCRPSQMLNLTGTMAAFQFDLAAAVALWRWKEKQVTGDREHGTEEMQW
jgi:hypothetical protein